MDEYISKQAILKHLNDCKEDPLFDPDMARICFAISIFIEEMQAADVQPVKHGRWIGTHISLCKWIPEDEKEEGHSFYMAEMKCSCCERYNTVTFVLTLNKPDFCQLCGARMIKDGDAE